MASERGSNKRATLCNGMPSHRYQVRCPHISSGPTLLLLISSSRGVIEDAVESFLQTPFKSQDCSKTIRAHLLRAKSRIAGELHDAAHQGGQGPILLCKLCDLLCHYPHSSDVRAILLLDPYHYEARQLLALLSGKNLVGTRTGNVSLDWPRHID